jgi:hypothetical protein
MLEMVTNAVLVAADVSVPWKNNPERFSRRLTVVDQANGSTEVMEVDSRVNGDLDGTLNTVVRLRVRKSDRWEGDPGARKIRTRCEVVGLAENVAA